MNSVTLPQLVAILSGLSAFFAIVAGAFKLGSVTNRVESAERTVVKELSALADRFAEFTTYIHDASQTRQEWSSWRSQIDERMSVTESERQRTSKNIHDLRDTVQAQGLILAVIEDRRKNEPSDRRQHP